MTEAPKSLGFRAQIRELLSHEPVTLVPVTERNASRFTKTVDALGSSATEDGMLPMTHEGETPDEWLGAVRSFWLVGDKAADFSEPENVAGFVSTYEPEHLGKINDWLIERSMHAYEAGALVELSSYVQAGPEARNMETSAIKQALSKVFMDEEYRDARAVTVWVTHTPENIVDPEEQKQMKAFGARSLGSLRYDQGESVDSTCFLITRRSFLDALTGSHGT